MSALEGRLAVPLVRKDYGFGLARFLFDPIDTMTRLRERWGEVAPLSLGGEQDWYCVFGGRANREVLSAPDDFRINPNPYPFPIRSGTALHRFNQGLVYVDGASHKRQRSQIASAFRPAHLPAQCEPVVDEARAFSDSLRTGSVIDLSRSMRALTLRVSQRTLFGVSGASDDAELEAAMLAYVRALSSPGVFLVPVDVPFGPQRQLYAAAEELEKVVLRRVARRRLTGLGADLMSTLLRDSDAAGGATPEPEVVANLVILFLAAHETSCQGLLWTLFLLSQHPEMLRELQEELAHELGDAPASLEQVKKLSALERVVKEALRLLSPVVYMLRVASRDLSFHGFRLKAGTRVVWSPLLSHRDASVFVRPERFRPERWLETTPTPFSYLPFGAGTHACVGGVFAMHEIMLVLACLLQHHAFELVPGSRVDYRVHLALGTREPLRMRVIERGVPPRVELPRGSIRNLVAL